MRVNDVLASAQALPINIRRRQGVHGRIFIDIFLHRHPLHGDGRTRGMSRRKDGGKIGQDVSASSNNLESSSLKLYCLL